MKSLPSMFISEEELAGQLANKVYATGGESVICRTDTEGALDKIFVDSNTREVSFMSDNKHNKITSLYRMNLEHNVQPLASIHTEKRLVGYRMTQPKCYLPLEAAVLTRKQKIAILRESQRVLQEYAKKDITYADIKADNILVKPQTGEIMLCDMDNIRLGVYPVDLKSHDIMRYYEIYGEMDETVSAYMHNLLTLQQLGFPNDATEYYHDIIVAIKRGEYPTGFKQAARPIIESLPHPKEFTGEYVAQYIKR